MPQLESEFSMASYNINALGIDAYHPFPKLNNIELFVDIDTEDDINSAIVQIPSLISRFIHLTKVISNISRLKILSLLH